MDTNKFLNIILITLSFSIHSALTYAVKEPLVTVTQGVVRGRTLLSRSGREYDAYRGIPYAKPPIGNLRFKAPEPAEKWDFPLDATAEAPFCIQKNYFFANAKVEGQEDCLTLNVYIPKTNDCELLPVMVFIHWGGFFAGRGSSNYLGAEYFMDKDVILVTFNYRLGVLGFLSTLDDAAPGNFALKDQSMALQWVQDNIKLMGGDRDKVTIFGQSAGGGSVHYHLLSPLSKGLFHQAISQSGSALSLWAKPLNAIQPTVLAAQASFVGCEKYIGDNQLLIGCLRNVSAEDLVASGDKFKYFSIEPLTPFTTVVEVETKENPKPFFTKEPLEYIESKEFSNVPWIVGVVQDEGILRAGPLLRQPEIREQLNAQFDTLFPQLMGFALSVGPNETTLAQNATNQYLYGKNFVNITDPKSIQGFIDLYSDRAFKFGTYQSVMLHAAKGHNPIWFYNFDYKGNLSYNDLFAATTEDIAGFNWGVCHCDDLLYLFQSSALLPNLSDENDLAMSNRMVELWTNFAIHGSPTISNAKNSINWTTVEINGLDSMKNENLYYLNISGSSKTKNIDFKMTNGFHSDRMKFWTSQSLAENIPGLD